MTHKPSKDTLEEIRKVDELEKFVAALDKEFTLEEIQRIHKVFKNTFDSSDD